MILALLTTCRSSSDEPELLPECKDYVAVFEACSQKLGGPMNARSAEVSAVRTSLLLPPNAGDAKRDALRDKCVTGRERLRSTCVNNEGE